MQLVLMLLMIACPNVWANPACGKTPKDFFLLDATPQAKDAGIDYPKELTAAFKKDQAALVNLFRVTPHLDGSGADTHAGVLWAALQCWGDKSFAASLRAQPKEICARVLQQLDYETEESGGYKGAFPKTDGLRQECL